MIAADELMLGNYVIANSEVLVVDYINGNNHVGFTDDAFAVPCEEVFPIELSMPWLEKLGFKWMEGLETMGITVGDDLYEVYQDSGGFYFTFANVSNDTWKQMPDRKVEYVHHLQNIFYSASRKKLKLI